VKTKREPAKAHTKVLTVDIGGTNVKLLASGETEPRKLRSGPDLSPTQMIDAIRKATSDWKYTAVSLGYPGRVSVTGPVAEPGNLGSGWVGFDFAAAFGCPVRIVNDAILQALGSYDGGRMLFVGFGTGVGSVLVINHTVVPLELGELKWKGKTLCDRFGRDALERHGEKRWRERVLDTIPSLQRAFLADYVVVGGGNSKYLLEPLPPNVRIGHNLTAFRGGSRLWGIEEMPTALVNDEKSELPESSIGSWRLL
jgi:polyphosphate glucokinase